MTSLYVQFPVSKSSLVALTSPRSLANLANAAPKFVLEGANTALPMLL